MAWLRALAQDAGGIAWGNRWWMGWNTLLAVLPVLMAVPLFRYRGRWRAWTWVVLAGFVLVLPNAPYVVTDLVHLRADVAQAGSDATVYAGILPLYGAFVAVGFGCYAVSLREIGGWLRRTGRGHAVGAVELALHAACAVGVLLGRVARLNSWDTLTQPESTLARALDTLSWRGSPIVIVGLLVVIWLGHAVTRFLATAAAAWVTRHLPGARHSRGRYRSLVHTGCQPDGDALPASPCYQCGRPSASLKPAFATGRRKPQRSEIRPQSVEPDYDFVYRRA